MIKRGLRRVINVEENKSFNVVITNAEKEKKNQLTTSIILDMKQEIEHLKDQKEELLVTLEEVQDYFERAILDDPRVRRSLMDLINETISKINNNE